MDYFGVRCVYVDLGAGFKEVCFKNFTANLGGSWSILIHVFSIGWLNHQQLTTPRLLLISPFHVFDHQDWSALATGAVGGSVRGLRWQQNQEGRLVRCFSLEAWRLKIRFFVSILIPRGWKNAQIPLGFGFCWWFFTNSRDPWDIYHQQTHHQLGEDFWFTFSKHRNKQMGVSKNGTWKWMVKIMENIWKTLSKRMIWEYPEYPYFWKHPNLRSWRRRLVGLVVRLQLVRLVRLVVFGLDMQCQVWQGPGQGPWPGLVIVGLDRQFQGEWWRPRELSSESLPFRGRIYINHLRRG